MKNLILGGLALLLAGCGQEPGAKTSNVDAVKVEDAKPEPPPPPPAAREPTIIPVGYRVTVRTTSAVSSETAIPGQLFSASLAEPILVDGEAVVPKGASVGGVILSVGDGGRVKGVASVSLGLDHIRVGKNRLAVSTSVYTKAAPATKKADAVKIGIGAGIGAAIGAMAGGGKGAAVGAASGAGAGTAVVLATHGEPAVVEEESILSFRLAKSLAIPQ